mmetsp:Transcript_4804/g.10424  ORF Transcript_4804/g.10424 Transcript_4804/m.10424 type:complete len:216 (-) Transcript_4804:693-1340(-)
MALDSPSGASIRILSCLASSLAALSCIESSLILASLSARMAAALLLLLRLEFSCRSAFLSLASWCFSPVSCSSFVARTSISSRIMSRSHSARSFSFLTFANSSNASFSAFRVSSSTFAASSRSARSSSTSSNASLSISLSARTASTRSFESRRFDINRAISASNSRIFSSRVFALCFQNCSASFRELTSAPSSARSLSSSSSFRARPISHSSLSR